MVQIPYGLYWNRANAVDQHGVVQTNSLGYRQGSRETAVFKPPEMVRVLVLGGSTTFSDAGAPTPEDAWPIQMQSILNARAGCLPQVEVINAGLNYALSTELLIHFLLVGLKLEPDVVVWEGPGNDWLPEAAGDATPDYRETRAPGDYPRPRFGEVGLVSRSAAARLLLGLWLRATPSTGLVSLERPDINWASPTVADRVASAEFESFRANLRILVEISASRGIPVVLVPFVLGSEQIRTRSGRAESFLAAQTIATDRMNAVMAEIARESKGSVTYVDSDPAIPEDCFVDGTHLNPAGERMKARWIAAALCHALGRRSPCPPDPHLSEVHPAATG